MYERVVLLCVQILERERESREENWGVVSWGLSYGGGGWLEKGRDLYRTKRTKAKFIVSGSIFRLTTLGGDNPNHIQLVVDVVRWKSFARIGLVNRVYLCFLRFLIQLVEVYYCIYRWKCPITFCFDCWQFLLYLSFQIIFCIKPY